MCPYNICGASLRSEFTLIFYRYSATCGLIPFRVTIDSAFRSEFIGVVGRRLPGGSLFLCVCVWGFKWLLGSLHYYLNPRVFRTLYYRYLVWFCLEVVCHILIALHFYCLRSELCCCLSCQSFF